ncbi:hypothetical protein ColTof4_05711 [Colletotrichum tofieldiae]|nr:hypothetical protein ColTof3_00873 [Colletotrichum tofieldiae]GKT73288.1 hypothetical protein ColTof4_05711 [Colletotrichum tofieldiae]
MSKMVGGVGSSCAELKEGEIMRLQGDGSDEERDRRHEHRSRSRSRRRVADMSWPQAPGALQFPSS